MFLVKCLAGLVLWWWLLRLRLLPVRVMQCWFFLINLVFIFPMSGLTVVFAPLRWLGVPNYYVQRMCILPLCVAFRVVWLLSPQIRMWQKFDANEEGRPRSWYDLPLRGCAIVGNHTSFWDVYCFIIVYPFWRLLNVRTLLKASLLDIPLFGPAMRRVGHFPVFFKSDEDGQFQVDKDRQAVVQKEVDRHIGEGGNIALFPEGALNRNPAVLQPFRFGTFQTIVDHKLRTYYAVIVGNEATWPRKALMGGRPADLCARIGSFPIDFETEDAKVVASKMQAFMQKVYEEAARDQQLLKAGKTVPGYIAV